MKNLVIALTLCAILSPLASHAADPSMHDFAYGVELRTEGDAPFYRLRLPQYVYSTVTDPGLRDMAVFNADGETVMYSLGLPKPGEPVEESMPVPFYPIPAQWSGGTDGVQLEVVRDESGSVIRVESRSEPESAAPSRPSAYLIDTSGIEGPVGRFELSWPESSGDFMARALLEHSDDLKYWKPTGVRDTVADLTYGSHRLTESTLRAVGLKARFYRLSFPGQDPPPMLSGVKAVLAGASEEPERDTGSAYPTRQEGDGFVEYVFDTNGHRPVDRLGVVLPEDNSLVQAEFFSRDTADGTWTRRASSSIYRFRSGEGLINSPDTRIAPVTDRYWMLRVKSGGGMGGGLPRLVYSWLPHELTFIARGDKPFTLAYGSARLTPEKLAGTGYMKDMRIGGTGLDREVEPTLATPGTRVDLGGMTALEPLETPTDWTVYMLWSILLGGVVLLAWMALGILKKVDLHRGNQDDNT